MKDAGLMPYAWGWHPGLDGFANFFSPYSWVFPLIYTPQVIFGNLLGMDWSLITRLVYLYPYLVLAVIAPILLLKYIFPGNKFYLPAVFIFIFNTYSLLLASGEIFLAIAYALAPIIFVLFLQMLKIYNSRSPKKYIFPLITGLVLSLQIMNDPRITYVTMTMVVMYLLAYCIFQIKDLIKCSIKNYIYPVVFLLLIPGTVVFLLNAFWIIPSVMHGGNPVEALGFSHSSVGAVNYFSFAKFENTFSLLHPNWPENIFGKVDFMKPEFLLLPVLAFASLLFVIKLKERKQKLYILFFSSIGLIGAFLSKGVNDPWGGVYLWLFKYVPGFIMFRDPTKWYLLVAISYTVLIPFTIWKIYEWLKTKNKSKIFSPSNIFLSIIVLYLLFLIRPAIFGQLNGLLRTTSVPKDYLNLEKFLVNQPGYFRTLWVPSKQRFGYYSESHPEISAQALYNLYDNKILLNKLPEENSEKLLEESSVKYVIVPYDFEKEIFLTDRKYDNSLYLKTISQLEKIKYLTKIGDFGRITVLQNLAYKDHFWSPDPDLKINYRYLNPVKYEVGIENAKKGNILVFSEAYDSKWTASGTSSSKYADLFNSFVLTKNGNYTLEIYYPPQDWVNLGLWVSLSALIISLSLLLFLPK
jgi:hypothetical protein